MNANLRGLNADPAPDEPLERRAAARRDELRAELDRGRAAIAELDARRDELAATVIRIAGALQVLDELLATGSPGSSAQD